MQLSARSLNLSDVYFNGVAMLVSFLKRFIFTAVAVAALSVSLFETAYAQASKKPLYLSYEQRLVVSYLLAGSGESEEKQMEVTNRFEETARKYMAQPIKDIQVKNFQEFLTAYRGPWPEAHSLEADLRWIETSELRGPVRFVAANAKLQSQIDGFIKRQTIELQKAGTSQETLMMAQQLTQGRGFGKILPKSFTDANQKREWILEGFKLATSLLQTQLQAIQKTGADVAMAGKLNGSDKALKTFLTTAFQEYFGRLSLATKKQIISQVMGRNLNMGTMEKFELMVLSSGPQFQKLLQIVAREAGVSADLLAIFKKLESKAQPAPEVEVRRLFEAERAHYNWVSYEPTPLGTGTMAQVHKGVVETSGGQRDVVIRFLKPDMALRVAEDYRILSELAPIIDGNPEMKKLGFPKLVPVVKDLNKTVTDELDLEDTIKRQIRGREVYTQELFMNGKTYKNAIQVSVPEVIMHTPGSKLHVQELVHGSKLDKVAEYYAKEIPDLKQKVVEQIAEMWITEVMFKSGFYHSDLHQGNFMVEFTEPAIKVNILDFGMGGVISKSTREGMLILGGGLELKSADIITRAIWGLSEKSGNQINQNELKELVKQRLQSVEGSLERPSIEKWTTWSMDNGIKFPFEFVSLNRGLVILDRMLKESGSPYTGMAMARLVAKKNVSKIVYDLKVKGQFSWSELAKLGWVSLKGSSTAPEAKPVMIKVRCEAVHLF